MSKPKRMFVMIEIEAAPGWNAKEVAAAAAQKVGECADLTVLQTHVNVAKAPPKPAPAG